MSIAPIFFGLIFLLIYSLLLVVVLRRHGFIFFVHDYALNYHSLKPFYRYRETSKQNEQKTSFFNNESPYGRNRNPSSIRHFEHPDLVFTQVRTPSPKNRITLEYVKKEPVDTIFNETFATLIKDDRFDGSTCRIEPFLVETFEMQRRMLQVLADLAKSEGFPVILGCGTLLGYARDKHIIPYDSDIDVYVPSWVYDILAKYEYKRPILEEDYNKYKFALHPEFRFVPPYKQRRFDCYGQVVPGIEGQCSIIGFMGRFLYNQCHIDLFTIEHLPNNHSVIIDSGYIDRVPEDWVLPLRPCSFMGVEVLCPNQYDKILRVLYGPETHKLTPIRLCINGSYVSFSDDPALKSKRMNQLIDRYGVERMYDVNGVSKESFTNYEDDVEVCAALKSHIPSSVSAFCMY